MGLDEELEQFRVEDFYVFDKVVEALQVYQCPSIRVELDEYLVLWKPWRRLCWLKFWGVALVSRSFHNTSRTSRNYLRDMR